MRKSSLKDKKKDKNVKKEFEIEYFKSWGNEHYATKCPSKKKMKEGHASHLEWHIFMSIKWKK